MSGSVSLQGVSKAYQPGSWAVEDASLELRAGELLALLGPSGCGKTTTLRLIAGLERPDRGAVAIDGRQVAGDGAWVPPEQRGVGLVFQDGALFPHLNVADNVAFALHQQSRAARAERVAALLDLVGLSGLEARMPHQLSGGQQQRVALARALAPQPAVVLLDEPFANLDAALRVELREEVVAIVRASRTTALLVTHDQEEALSLADRVAVMLAGRIVQLDTPQRLYAAPRTPAVATFVGQATLLPGVAAGDHADCALGRLPLATPAHGPVRLLLRPEAVALAPAPDGPWRIARLRFFGHDQILQLRAPDGAELVARARPQPWLQPGASVAARVDGPVVAYPAVPHDGR